MQALIGLQKARVRCEIVPDYCWAALRLFIQMGSDQHELLNVPVLPLAHLHYSKTKDSLHLDNPRFHLQLTRIAKGFIVQISGFGLSKHLLESSALRVLLDEMDRFYCERDPSSSKAVAALTATIFGKPKPQPGDNKSEQCPRKLRKPMRAIPL
jgi:hypothetical protein